MQETTSPTLQRLAAKSEQRPGPLDTPCLIWTGYVNDSGYGITTNRTRKLQRVHRLAWVERHGPIPAETPCVLHRCDVRACWADDHLFLGTKADNTADMLAKRRFVDHQARKTHCPQNHPYTPDNLVQRASGWRTCRTCNRDRERIRRAARRAQARPVS